jgi:hypothetical protein
MPVAAPRHEPTEARFDACNRLLRTIVRCLERAIVAQRRVIGVITRAAAATIAPAGYGAPGSQGYVGRPAAFALPARLSYRPRRRHDTAEA